MPASPTAETTAAVTAATAATATAAAPPAWQRWLPRASALVSAFTTLCCLGLSALVSLSTAIGATFLTQDSTLRPLLAVSLVLTLAGSAITWRRHRNPLPFLLTLAAAATIFWTLYGGGTGHAPSGHSDTRGDGMGHEAEGNGAGGGLGVWAGLVLLLAAQVWDAWRLRLLKRQTTCTTC